MNMLDPEGISGLLRGFDGVCIHSKTSWALGLGFRLFFDNLPGDTYALSVRDCRISKNSLHHPYS